MLVSAAREKGVKRALSMLPKAQAVEFKEIMDQSAAPWWNPDQLWDTAKSCVSSLFDTAPTQSTPTVLH